MEEAPGGCGILEWPDKGGELEGGDAGREGEGKSFARGKREGWGWACERASRDSNGNHPPSPSRRSGTLSGRPPRDYFLAALLPLSLSPRALTVYTFAFFPLYEKSASPQTNTYPRDSAFSDFRLAARYLLGISRKSTLLLLPPLFFLGFRLFFVFFARLTLTIPRSTRQFLIIRAD